MNDKTIQKVREMKPICSIIWEPIDESFETAVVPHDYSNLKNILSYVDRLKPTNIVLLLVCKGYIKTDPKNVGVFREIYAHHALAIGRLIKKISVCNHWDEDQIIYVTDNLSHKREAKFYCPNLTIINYADVEKVLMNLNFQTNQARFTCIKNIPIFNCKEDRRFLDFLELKIEILGNCGDAILQIGELMDSKNLNNITRTFYKIEQLMEFFSNSDLSCKYIIMYDKFKSYGVVGFFCWKSDCIRDLVLSSDIIGFGLENYIVKKLKLKFKLKHYRKLPIFTLISEKSGTINVLLKGGCDIEQIAPYLFNADINLRREFNIIPFRRDHSYYLTGAALYTDYEKNKIEKEVPFVTKETYKTLAYSKNTHYLVWSSLMEMTQGIYIDDNNLAVAYKNYDTPYDFLNDKYGIFNYNDSIKFLNKWHYSPHISAEQYEQNLNIIYSCLHSTTKLIIITGAEVPTNDGKEKERYVTHSEINRISEKFAREHKRVYLLDVRNYVRGEGDLTNNIRHYKGYVYRNLANKLVEMIVQCEEDNHEQNS